MKKMFLKVTKDENDIQWIEVKNNKNLSFEFCSYGASTYFLHYDEKPLILELKDKEEFLSSNQYFNKSLGIVAGRIVKDIEIDGEEYQLLQKEGTNYCEHGGEAHGLTYKNWDTNIIEKEDSITVEFTIFVPDGYCGFPGSQDVVVSYEVKKDTNEFTIWFKVKSYGNSVASLTNHIYWNLNGSNLNNTYLKFPAEEYGVVDNTLLIVGKDKLPEYLSFNEEKNLKDVLDNLENNKIMDTIDTTYLFGDQKPITLVYHDDKFKVTMETDHPAMNVYVDSTNTDVVFNNFEGKFKRRGIVFEPQYFVYDVKSIIIRDGEERVNYIKYKIEGE